VAGVCWGDKGTYARESKLDKSVKIYDSGYIPPAETSSLSFPVCDFASNEMLDRMAQFYYNESLLHAQLSEDGNQMSYEYIVMFYGVIASSELSCDVACLMRTVKFDALTGDNYVETLGTTYPDDPGNTVSYRRFYFIYNPKENEPKAGKVYFTVTGCTNSDYTAPDAQVNSADQGYDVPISVPKIYQKTEKSRPQIGDFNPASFASALASTTVSTGLGMGLGGLGGRGGAAGALVLGTVGGVAGGFAGNSLAEAISNALPASKLDSNMTTAVVKTDEKNYMVLTNNNHWSINHGPIYEQRVRDASGYVPELDFCRKAITSQLLCSNQFVLRDTINAYHTKFPSKRVKTVYEIEPRGVDGCYYKWTTVSYDDVTNLEGTDVNQEALVKKYVLNDTSTCVFEPEYDTNKKDIFITDPDIINTRYPIRQYSDPITGITKYPTKTVTSRATYQGRYIRILPSQIARDSVMQISQIAVYDPTESNIALQAVRVHATSIASGSAPATKIKDGKLIPLSGVSNVYKSSGSSNDFIEIDLGKNFFIGRVVYYGALDCSEDTRNNGVRIQIRTTQSGNPVAEMTTSSIENTQTVDFTTKILTASIPQKPFNVPRALPPDKILSGNCVSRCQDKPQIDAFISQYNAANTSKQILKVLRAVTPKDDRCDYEVEMVSKDGTNNNIFSKELLSRGAFSTNSTQGDIYGRFIRFATPPNTTTSLSIKQIQVYDSTKTNIARGKYVTASSSTVTSTSADAVVTNPAVVVDGVGTSTWTSNSSSYEYLEIDLGQVYPINSVKYIGSSNSGGRLEVRYDELNEPGPNDKNVFTLNGDTEQTFSFNTCSYNFMDNFTNSTFIQDTTPYLEAVDTSGGVLTFENIAKNVVNIFNTIVNPITSQDPSAILGANVLDAQKSASNILKSIGGNVTLQGCPNTKCSDKSVLDAIMARYNADNATATGGAQYGRETNTMKAIASSGIGGPMSCDVLFTGLYELYDDYLYPPSFTESKTMVKRFTLQNTGGCVMAVAPGSGSVIDVSGEAAFGIMSPSAGLTTPYLLESSPQIDCRNPAVLTSLKQKLASIPTSTPTTYKSILQSFANGPNTCEYMMTKDKGSETGINTYVTAKFSGNTLQTVADFDPDTLTSTTDSSTGDITYRQNGVVVNLPFLFNYDNTTPSPRVNEMVYIL